MTRCDCGRSVGNLSTYQRCCAAAVAVRAWRMWGKEAGLGCIERVAQQQGQGEADEVAVLARELAHRLRAEEEPVAV